MKKTGYKEMLRDRCPKVVTYALKYHRVMEAWINHVYKNFIWIYPSNEERLKATRIILGLNKNPKEFIFADTIDWNNISAKEKESWKEVQKTVSWYQKQHLYAENDYADLKDKGKDIKTIKYELMRRYLIDMCPTKDDDEKTRNKKNIEINKFVNFLIDTFEHNI